MKLFTILGISLLLTSCATIYTGTKNIVHITSDPQHASVMVNGTKVGETPVTLKLKRSLFKKCSITLKKDGYQDKIFTVGKKFLPISILGTTFIVVDVFSGGIVKYKQAYYNEELTATKADLPLAHDYNLKDNYYVITAKDTFYTEPFQEFKYKSIFSSSVDLKFKLLNGETKSFPLYEVEQFSTLEIYRHQFGYLILQVQTSLNFMEKKYIKVIWKKNEKKQLYYFMEDLLAKDSIHLVKTLADVTAVSGTGQTAYVGNKPFYYIYKKGEKPVPIKEKDLQATIQKYFNNHQELIDLLSKKNKFKVLEKYVYKETKGADRYWNIAI